MPRRTKGVSQVTYTGFASQANMAKLTGKTLYLMEHNIEQPVETPGALRRQEDLNAFTDALMRWTDVKARAEPIYKRGHETRAQLVKSARQAFVRIGYIDCSVEDILQEANISRGTFYAHFASKKAIFSAVTTEHIKERINSTGVRDFHATDYRNRVRATITAFLNNYADNQDFSQVLEQAAHYDVEFRKVRLIIRDIFARRIARGIRRQQEQQHVSGELDPNSHALMILSTLTNIAQVEIAWRGKKPDQKMVEELANFWCNGIGLK